LDGDVWTCTGKELMAKTPAVDALAKQVVFPEELQLAGFGVAADFKPVKVGWKDEGDYGPVFLMDAKDECARGAQWVTRAAARKIAKKMKLPFEEF
jgi:hypothetical protein